MARHASENASGAAGGCPQSVESAVLRAFEDASRTREGCFAHRMSLPYRRSLFFTPNASENTSRTTGSLFWHRISLPYRRSLFLVRRASENASHLVVRSTGKLLPLRNFELHKRTRPTLVDLVQYSANSYLLSWNLVHPSLKKATICLAAASPALMLASAV